MSSAEAEALPQEGFESPGSPGAAGLATGGD
jgi:hypothetical protein